MRRILTERGRLATSVLWAYCLSAPAVGAQSPEALAADYLDSLWRASGVPSVAVTVVADRQIVFSRAVGFSDLDNLIRATPTTVYNIGSISKSMAAVAVMQLLEQGLVDLDDAIRTFVPAFPDKGTPITIRHLLTHTSGIRHYEPYDFPRGLEWDNVATFHTLDEAITLFKDEPLLFEPGTYFSYTSYGANLLQGVVETAAGVPFEDYMIDNVWSPAGMLSSSFDRPERIVLRRARGYRVVGGRPANYYPNENVTYKYAGGGMLSTAEDLARFAVALMEGRILSLETVELMFTPQLVDVPQFEGHGEEPTPMRWEQAFIWRIRFDEEGRPYVNHCGQVKGFNSCLILYVEEGLAVAVIENGGGVGPALREARVFASLFRARD